MPSLQKSWKFYHDIIGKFGKYKHALQQYYVQSKSYQSYIFSWKKIIFSVNLLINLNVFSSHLDTIEPHMLAEHFWEEKIPIRKDGIALAQ